MSPAGNLGQRFAIGQLALQGENAAMLLRDLFDFALQFAVQPVNGAVALRANQGQGRDLGERRQQVEIVGRIGSRLLGAEDEQAQQFAFVQEAVGRFAAQEKQLPPRRIGVEQPPSGRGAVFAHRFDERAAGRQLRQGRGGAEGVRQPVKRTIPLSKVDGTAARAQQFRRGLQQAAGQGRRIDQLFDGLAHAAPGAVQLVLLPAKMMIQYALEARRASGRAPPAAPGPCR